ncbi:MAG TPA: glutathione S-transferase family protein [Kofleriaceae bacterium]|jgi:glutathione S-transferase|nr:glutathione S-transferase family protein [Kofleriaceae bacterium]
MKLYGTTTSPFVRRVRVVAAEVGVPIELINTATDDGQAALRAVSPIWKVPVADIGGRVLYDSRVIIDWLTTVNGWGGLRPPADRWRDANLVNAIDGALESAIQLFYLRREGIDVTPLPFGQRQLDRIAAIFAWVAGELGPDAAGAGLGLPELSLLATLDWMELRDAYPVARHDAAFAALRAAHRDRPSLAATRPVVS